MTRGRPWFIRAPKVPQGTGSVNTGLCTDASRASPLQSKYGSHRRRRRDATARYRREILAQGKPAAREERPTGNLATALQDDHPARHIVMR